MEPAEIVQVHQQALEILEEECRKERFGPQQNTFNEERKVLVVDQPSGTKEFTELCSGMLGKILFAPYLGIHGCCFVKWGDQIVKLGPWEWEVVQKKEIS